MYLKVYFSASKDRSRFKLTSKHTYYVVTLVIIHHVFRNVGIWLMTVILTIHQNISSQAFCSEALKKPDGNLISSKSLRKSLRSLILKSNSSRVQRGTRYLQRLNSILSLIGVDTVIKFSNHFHRKPGGKYFHKKLSSFGKRN